MKTQNNVWTHIILEAHCLRKVSTKKDKYLYEIVNNEFIKTKRIPNPNFDLAYKTPRKPEYCPGIPQYICLEKNCPHLGYTNADKEDYNFLNRLKKVPKKRLDVKNDR